MKDFFNKFENLKGAKFITINGYENKYGEIANVSVNANISVKNAKVKDLKTLKSLTEKDLKQIANENKLPLETMKIGLGEMIESAEKNLSADMDDKTNQSKGQADAYIHLCPSVRLHKETLNIHVSGFFNSKKVLVEGEYPKKNKRVKTLCKDAISEHCDLKMLNYRQYKVGNMENIKITGDTLQMK